MKEDRFLSPTKPIVQFEPGTFRLVVHTLTHWATLPEFC